MALTDGRELFSILADTAGYGNSPTVASVGLAVSGAVEVPSLVAQDAAGNFQHVPVQASNAVPGGINVPVLGASDGTNLQFIDVRASGVVAGSHSVPTLGFLDASSHLQYPDVRPTGVVAGSQNQPVLVALDPSNHLAFLKVDNTGELIVNTSGGTPVSAEGTATSNPANNDGTGGAFVTVATLTLTASKTFNQVAFIGGGLQSNYWQLVQTNNMTTTTVAEGAFSNSGSPSVVFPGNMNLQVASGGTGTQNLILQAKQIGGPASGLHGTITAVQM